MHRSAVAFLLLFCSVILWCSPALAQTTSGRWTIGISGGLNIWKNDVYDLTPSPGVIVDAQYGFSSVFSAGVSVGFESLKSKSSDLTPGEPFPYMKMHVIPATFDFCVNLLPGEIIAPFLAFGGGVIAYQLLGAGGVGLPDKEFRFSYLAEFGIGVQAFRSDAFSVTAELGYAGMEENLDRVMSGSFDGYMFGRIGLRLHFGEIITLAEPEVVTLAPLPTLTSR